MIDKKTDISTPELNLFPIQGKNIELSFNGDRISSDGGLLLLRELDSQLNLLSSASNCIHDERDQRYIDHSIKELLTQRVFQIAAGYEDCNNCNGARGSMELRIKDHKLYLKSDRSSCSKFTANQFRLFLHSMAYILIHTLQKQVLKGSEYANATMKTIQLKIIKTAAWVKEMKTKIKIELPQFCTTKKEQIKGFEMLIMLRT